LSESKLSFWNLHNLLVSYPFSLWCYVVLLWHGDYVFQFSLYKQVSMCYLLWGVFVGVFILQGLECFLFIFWCALCCSSLNAQNRLVHLCSIWFIQSILKWYCNFIVVGQSIEWSWLWLFEWRWMKFFLKCKVVWKKLNQIIRWICLREVDVGLLVCVYTLKEVVPIWKHILHPLPTLQLNHKHSSLRRPCDYDINTSNFSSSFII